MRLRITSGVFRGRFINAPHSELTRPTTERVRESIFNYLNNRMDFNGVRVLDLYSGSGALGFEALSRGVKSVDFVERNYVPYKNLQNNILLLSLQNQCHLFKTSALQHVKKCSPRQYDLILADPPFFEFDIHDVVRHIQENDILTESGILLVERSNQTEEQDTQEFKIEPFRRIGDTLLYLFQKE